MSLHGRHLIGLEPTQARAPEHRAVNAATGEALEPAIADASAEEIDRALALATEAHAAGVSHEQTAALLDRVAAEIEGLGAALVERAMLETGLPEARIVGELDRRPVVDDAATRDREAARERHALGLGLDELGLQAAATQAGQRRAVVSREVDESVAEQGHGLAVTSSLGERPRGPGPLGLILGLAAELGQQAVDVVRHSRDCIRLRDRVARSTPRSRPGGLLDRVAPRGYHRRA